MLTCVCFHFHHNTSIHLEETTVGIPSKFSVASLFGESFDNLVIDSKVEDGVHHSRHRLASTGTNRKEKWVFEITELLAHGFFDLGDVLLDLRVESLRIRLSVRIIISADFGGDCEASRNGNSDAAHFGEVCAFSSEEGFHRTVTVASSLAEVVDVLLFLGGLFSSLFFGSHGRIL